MLELKLESKPNSNSKHSDTLRRMQTCGLQADAQNEHTCSVLLPHKNRASLENAAEFWP